MDGTARRLVKQTIDERVRERLRLEELGLDGGAGWELARGGERSNQQGVPGGANGDFLEGWLDWLDSNGDRTLRSSVAD